MSDDTQASVWRRYRMPIILGVIALSSYALSIVWFIFGRGQIS